MSQTIQSIQLVMPTKEMIYKVGDYHYAADSIISSIKRDRLNEFENEIVRYTILYENGDEVHIDDLPAITHYSYKL